MPGNLDLHHVPRHQPAGGSNRAPAPVGVPVRTMSPASGSRRWRDSDDGIEREHQPRRGVLLAHLAIDPHGESRWESGSSFVRGDDPRPMLPERSKFLPCVTLNLPWRSQSRTVPSLARVRPKMCPRLLARIWRPPCPR